MTTVVVNGSPRELDPGAPERLIGWLRGSLGLCGTKPGCGEGACGACTVLLDGVPVLSCQVPLSEAVGRSVTTVEGLETGGCLHSVQEALIEEGATQCGYCTPGMALRAAALLASDPHPGDDAIFAGLDVNLCRCGCYLRILRAVRRAASRADGPASAVAPTAEEPALWGLTTPRQRWPHRGTCASPKHATTLRCSGRAWCGWRRPTRPAGGRGAAGRGSMWARRG